MVAGNESAPNPRQPAAEVLQAVTASDIEDFARLLPQLSDRSLTDEEIAANLLHTVMSPSSKVVVIRDDEGRVQASATGNLIRSPTGVKGWVDDVVTDKDHRGRGYNTVLMHALHDWFAESGASSANLTSKPERTAARRYYEWLGYGLRETGVFRKRLHQSIGSAALE